MKQNWAKVSRFGMIIGLLCGLLFACSGGTMVPDDAAEVLELVINSHTRWQTVQGSGSIVWTGPSGEQQEYAQEFAVAQPASARFLATQSYMQSSYDLWISDGAYIYNANTQSKLYTRRPLPAFAFDLSMLETPADDVDPVSVVHPFSMLIESPVAQFLYPHWFAQQVHTDYQFLGEEEWLGRKVWLVEYTSDGGTSRGWIDQATGVILRYTLLGFVDFEMTSITFDAPIDAKVFTLPADYEQDR